MVPIEWIGGAAARGVRAVQDITIKRAHCFLAQCRSTQTAHRRACFPRSLARALACNPLLPYRATSVCCLGFPYSLVIGTTRESRSVLSRSLAWVS